MNITTRPLTATIYELRIEGRPQNANWISALSAGLAERGAQILSGRVQALGELDWEAEFQIDFANARVAPEVFDYLSVLRTATWPTSMAQPMLRRFCMARRLNGTLEVIVEAAEQVNLIGRLLIRYAGVGLFPQSLELWPQHGRTRCRFVLRGIGGNAPGVATPRALEMVLSRMLPRPATLQPLYAQA